MTKKQKKLIRECRKMAKSKPRNFVEAFLIGVLKFLLKRV